MCIIVTLLPIAIAIQNQSKSKVHKEPNVSASFFHSYPTNCLHFLPLLYFSFLSHPFSSLLFVRPLNNGIFCCLNANAKNQRKTEEGKQYVICNGSIN